MPDIEKLTTLGEQGDGCAIRDAVANLSFDEKRAIFQEIADSNSWHRIKSTTNIHLSKSETSGGLFEKDPDKVAYLNAGTGGFLGMGMSAKSGELVRTVKPKHGDTGVIECHKIDFSQ
jgi:hypothetical protein